MHPLGEASDHSVLLTVKPRSFDLLAMMRSVAGGRAVRFFCRP